MACGIPSRNAYENGERLPDAEELQRCSSWTRDQNRAAILLRPAAEIVCFGLAVLRFAQRAFCARLILRRPAADIVCAPLELLPNAESAASIRWSCCCTCSRSLFNCWTTSIMCFIGTPGWMITGRTQDVTGHTAIDPQREYRAVLAPTCSGGSTIVPQTRGGGWVTFLSMPFSPSDLPWWGWLLCCPVALVSPGFLGRTSLLPC